MSQVLRRFIPRAPRYVLRPNDRHIVRYAPESGAGPASVSQTTLINISETGMAVLVDAHDAPQTGERMKVELPVPGGDQIAWWAVVVRSELLASHWWAPKDPQSEDKILLALKFEELPVGHRRAIRQGLENRFIEELKENRARQWLYIKHLWVKYTWQIVGYALCTAAALWLLYMLSRPTPYYDPAKGTPWGQRFILFDWQKEK